MTMGNGLTKDKLCQACGNTYISSSRQFKNQKYCSEKCRKVIKNKMRSKKLHSLGIFKRHNVETGITASSRSKEYFREYNERFQRPRNKQRYLDDEIYRKRVNKSSSKSGRKSYALLRRKALEFLGGKCIYCGCDIEKALEINHINGGGAKEFRNANGKNTNTKKLHKTLYKEILSGERSDLELTCKVCNAVHYMKLIGLSGWTITWNKIQ